VPQGGIGEGARRRARLGAGDIRHQPAGRTRAGRPRPRRRLRRSCAGWTSSGAGSSARRAARPRPR
jgi:hypothetical protein